MFRTMPLIVLSSFVVVTSAAGQQQQASETGRMLRPLLITHVVADLNKSITFYREGMDLAVVSRPAPLADSALVKKLAIIRPGATARSATLAIPGSNLQTRRAGRATRKRHRCTCARDGASGR